MEPNQIKSQAFHPWHDFDTGKDSPAIVQAVIEIPQGSKCKYELDKPSGLLKLDRVLYSAVHYPANYGLIPRTYFVDDDPLDILIFASIPIASMCLIEARVVGLLKMVDGEIQDDKIIAVAHRDMAYNHVNDLSDLPDFVLSELRNFFEDYKKLEGKTVTIEGFEAHQPAFRCIAESQERYARKFAQ